MKKEIKLPDWHYPELYLTDQVSMIDSIGFKYRNTLSFAEFYDLLKQAKCSGYKRSHNGMNLIKKANFARLEPMILEYIRERNMKIILGESDKPSITLLQRFKNIIKGFL